MVKKFKVGTLYEVTSYMSNVDDGEYILDEHLISICTSYSTKETGWVEFKDLDLFEDTNDGKIGNIWRVFFRQDYSHLQIKVFGDKSTHPEYYL